MIDRACVAGQLRVKQLSLNHDTLLACGLSDCGRVYKHWNKQEQGVGYERAVIGAMRSIGNPELAALLPDILDGLAPQETLALALVPGALTFRAAAAWSSAQLGTASERLGRRLALLHALDPAGFGLPTRPAMQSVMMRPATAAVEWFTAAGAGSREVMALLQAHDQFRMQLQTLFEATNPTLVHNDLKWDNILVYPRAGETELTEVTLIDWEMAGLGDPCWDAGTVLGEFLAFWALSIPMVADEPPDTYMHLAKYPLEDLQPAIRVFWHSYAETMGFNAATAREHLIKSTRFAGARLIQTAYERTQTMNRLTPQIYLLLQLSLNVLEQPEDATAHLLGITSSYGGA